MVNPYHMLEQSQEAQKPSLCTMTCWKKTLLENDLLNKPHLLFNCDESGFSLEHKPGKLIGERGVKHINSITSGDKAQMTVLACVSASGYSMPPMVIFDRKRLKPEHTQSEIPGTIYALSSNGWIDSELFEEWFLKHFLMHISAMRPVLLLLYRWTFIELSTNINPESYKGEYHCILSSSSHDSSPSTT